MHEVHRQRMWVWMNGLEEGRLELMSQLIYESTKTNVWKYYFYFLFTV